MFIAANDIEIVEKLLAIRTNDGNQQEKIQIYIL